MGQTSSNLLRNVYTEEKLCMNNSYLHQALQCIVGKPEVVITKLLTIFLRAKRMLLATRSTLNILVIFYWNFLLGGSHLWPLSVNMSTSIIWCDSNKKVQYFSVWLWYTLCSPLMAYHHNDRLCEKVSWLLPNHIPIKLLFLFSTQLN